MTVRNLERLLAPRSVALVGASPQPASVGAILARNLLRGGFAGPIYLVNPHHKSIDGVACYRFAGGGAAGARSGGGRDAAVDCSRRHCASRGTRSPRRCDHHCGRHRQLRQSDLEAARPYCLRIQGPNCIGLLVLPASG